MITLMVSICVGSLGMLAVIFLFEEEVMELVSDRVRDFYYFWAWLMMWVFSITFLFLFVYLLITLFTKDPFS